MYEYTVFNYHITPRCNYHCIYCFGKFKGREPSFDSAKQIVDNVVSYFVSCGISNGRINFAGGEPLLYGHLDELIDYTNASGVSVSVISNASLLTVERIRAWKGKVSCIGISIDSLSDDANRSIGRSSDGRVIDLPRLVALSQAMHECDISLKINTVVSKRNLDEDFSPLYRSLEPDRIKLLQVHFVQGINDRAIPERITDDEFRSFCSRHEAFGSIIVPESEGTMENSYLMINPEGEFQLNNDGNYQTFGDLITTPLAEILKKVPLDTGKFDARYSGRCAV